ncbi:hypothetical protein CMI37_38615 [Candidatus Pacearchaeota archaeon]|nr:hypothetical protein [Candidatus Pacearchaeota archaeon]
MKFKVGFGKAELTKAVKGAAIAGGGAVSATVLNEVGLIPASLMEPPTGSFIVAALAVAINLARQIIRDNTPNAV